VRNHLLQFVGKRLKVREIDCENFELSNRLMKAQSKISFYVVMACLALGLSTLSVRAFSLLGPFEPWMEETNGLRQPGDIGGPMDITNEYRWNVPVVTYGFDQSFLDYFGTNGVAAVESAIQILNDLPPASQIVLTNYPFYSQHVNYQALALGLWDLKSETLSLLLEQVGLASPTRYVLVLRQWDPVFIPPQYLYTYPYSYQNYWPDWVYPDFIAQRNFDPQTLDASQYVNDTLYTAYIVSKNNQNTIVPITADPFAPSYTAVADGTYGGSLAGGFYTGLTYDDVGGLAYLLSTNNINYETLLSSINGVGTNTDSFVNGARRPGVDKITFVPLPVDSATGAFLTMTNQFTDTYITNGNVMRQQLARAISQPDFLFCAGDVVPNSTGEWLSIFSRTGTTNWVNHAALNGNPGGAGPGVIRPPARITFDKLGQDFYSDGSDGDEVVYDDPFFIGSFDGSSNAPIVYPTLQTGSAQLTVRIWLVMGQPPNWSINKFVWETNAPVGATFEMKTSTNLADWTGLFTVTNNGAICSYLVIAPSSSHRFYRLLPQ
jgi:hypothetical protein